MRTTSLNKSFLSPVPKPEASNLEAALGSAYVYYNELLTVTRDFKPSWSHSKSSGWMLKISDGRKALCYVIPLTGCYRISLTIREAERTELLQNTHLADLSKEIQNAQRFVEGYALLFIISNKKEHTRFINLLHALLLVRK